MFGTNENGNYVSFSIIAQEQFARELALEQLSPNPDWEKIQRLITAIGQLNAINYPVPSGGQPRGVSPDTWVKGAVALSVPVIGYAIERNGGLIDKLFSSTQAWNFMK